MEATTSKRSISSRERRHFLLAIGAGSVGTAMTPARGFKTTPEASAPNAKRRGYTVTAHIGKYYRTAKL
ncbi:MAG: formate dehydrogenase [Betaproteobacteria bacterium]|nr:MAG: formate dehydrogenase [Betaproteobacteria bacterium]